MRLGYIDEVVLQRENIIMMQIKVINECYWARHRKILMNIAIHYARKKHACSKGNEGGV